MVNILIADDNIDYAINLMNYINEKNENIKVYNIAKNGKETIKILNDTDNIDLVLLDYKMPFYNGKQVLDKVLDKRKYSNSFIIISGEIETVAKLRNNEMIHSIIYKTIDMSEIVKRINELIEYKESIKQSKIIKKKIITELLYLGYDISHKGTKYLIEVIEYIALNQNRTLERLEKDVYPKIAILYNESVHNIKCRINNATSVMYCNCEIEKLKKYFHFNIDTKPKVRTIIDTIVNNIMK